MLTLQQIHSWLITLKSDMNRYVSADSSISSTDKSTAKNSYSSIIDEIASECDTYFMNMKSAPLSDYIISVVSYLGFIDPEESSGLIDISSHFSCDNTFTEELLHSDTKTLFYNSGAISTAEMVKLNNFKNKISNGSSKDISDIRNIISSIRSSIMWNSFAMMFEVDKDKKPHMNKINIRETAELLYNTYKAYDIIKSFNFDIYIPSYIEEEHS